MRFTPEGKSICRVKALNVFSRVFRSTTTPTCVAYIKDDSSGIPTTTRTSKAYNPSVRAWDRIDFNTPIDYTSDFWIAITLPNTNSTDSTALVTDGSLNYSDRTRAWQATAQEWQVPPSQPGDFLIRAIVDYIAVEESSTSKILTLKQNLPNPVLTNTKISYILPKGEKVKLVIYDASGRIIKTLTDGLQQAGNKEILWNKRNTNGGTVSSGIYFYRLSTENKTITKTIVVL